MLKADWNYRGRCKSGFKRNYLKQSSTVIGNPIVHFEIGCRDSSRAQKFFSELFGWTVEQVGSASMIDTGSDLGIGGIFHHWGTNRTIM